MSNGERTLKRAISQRITLAPKRGSGGCAFKKCCEETCFREMKHVRTSHATKEEIVKAVALRVEGMNLLAQSEDGMSFKARGNRAEKLALIIQGAAVPIDYGSEGTIDYSFCGDGFHIQTYSIEEMREILRGVSLDIAIMDAYVSAPRKERPDGRPGEPPNGLSKPFAELLAWIAALRSEEGEYLDSLMRNGGVNGVRAIARIAGEPAIDEKARKNFMIALCTLASCISMRGGMVYANNEELAADISRFSTLEKYYLTSEKGAKKIERGGMPLPLPNLTPQPHRMKQMARVCLEGLFQANINIASRIDSIINSGDEEIEENSERLRGMYETLKLGLRHLLDGNAVNPIALEILADGKTTELYGPITPETTHEEINMRMAEMDYGEQNIIRYSISRLGAKTPLDAESIWQMYRLFGTSSEYTREITEKMDRFLSA